MRLLAVAAALAILSCKAPARPGAIVIGTVGVDEAGLAGKPEIGRTGAQIAVDVQRALEATGEFVVREGGAARLRLDLEHAGRRTVPVIENGRSREREMAEVALTLELLRPDGDRLVAEGGAMRPTDADDSLDPEARRAAFDAALAAALDDAATALREQVEAHGKSDTQLVADLTARDVRVRDYAIRVLADRRSPAAVPVLIDRLQDENPEIVKRAAGALTAIGDRRAVAPMIDLTRRRGGDQVGPLLYAIASLGGGEAEAFLFTLESGSPDAEVRRAARGAYAELVHRKQEEARRTDTVPRNATP
jgi:hypothetical protein